MKKRNEKHEKRVKRMIVACGLCAIILTASTYAWFIGMKTVNVTAFDVKIAAIEFYSFFRSQGHIKHKTKAVRMTAFTHYLIIA